MEIERKYLVKEMPINIIKVSPIMQHYISYEPEIRIRNINHDNYFFTVKTNNIDIFREEFEVPISQDEYLKLITKAKLKIFKIRSYVDLENNLTAEIDTYENGLKIVEVEFKNLIEAEDFTPPDWFGREVTYDKMYRNINLAKKV